MSKTLLFCTRGLSFYPVIGKSGYIDRYRIYSDGSIEIVNGDGKAEPYHYDNAKKQKEAINIGASVVCPDRQLYSKLEDPLNTGPKPLFKFKKANDLSVAEADLLPEAYSDNSIVFGNTSIPDLYETIVDRINKGLITPVSLVRVLSCYRHKNHSPNNLIDRYRVWSDGIIEVVYSNGESNIISGIDYDNLALCEDKPSTVLSIKDQLEVIRKKIIGSRDNKPYESCSIDCADGRIGIGVTSVTITVYNSKSFYHFYKATDGTWFEVAKS